MKKLTGCYTSARNPLAEVSYNSSRKELTVHVPGNKPYQFEVFDINGNSAGKYNVSENPADIPVPKMKKGVYMVYVHGNRVNYTGKVFVY